MKRRIVQKTEKRTVAEKLCELQRQVCEYERYMGDLLVMLAKREPQCVIQHEDIWEGDWIWSEVKKLIQEVKANKKDDNGSAIS